MNTAFCSPETIIRRSGQRQENVTYSGDTKDIINTILRVDKDYAQMYIDTAAAQCLLGRTDNETMHNVWRFVKSNVRYVADRPGHEKIKTPGALFTSRFGDCKSFSIAVVSLLRALGFKNVWYKFAAYNPKEDYTHVYVMASKNGRDYILDAVYSRYDREASYNRKKEIAAASVRVAGIQSPGVQGDISNTVKIGGFILGGFILYSLLKD